MCRIIELLIPVWVLTLHTITRGTWKRNGPVLFQAGTQGMTLTKQCPFRWLGPLCGMVKTVLKRYFQILYQVQMPSHHQQIPAVSARISINFKNNQAVVFINLE